MNNVTMRATLNSKHGVEKVQAKGVGMLALIEQEDGSVEFRMLGKINPVLLMASGLQLTGKAFDQSNDHQKGLLLRDMEEFKASVDLMIQVMDEQLKDYTQELLREAGEDPLS